MNKRVTWNPIERSYFPGDDRIHFQNPLSDMEEPHYFNRGYTQNNEGIKTGLFVFGDKTEVDITDYPLFITKKLREEQLEERAKQISKMSYTIVECNRGAVISTNLRDSNNIFEGALIENNINNEVICAEENALIQLVERHNNLIQIELIVIYVDSDELYYPCGKCLQRISDFVNRNNDDKDCYILLMCNKNIEKLYKLSTLYPFNNTNTSNRRINIINENNKTLNYNNNIPFDENNIMSWKNSDICNWLIEIGYKKYVRQFEYSNITGKTLFILQENDLENIGIPVNVIPNLMRCINSLLNQDLLKHGLDVDRINDYICLLDGQRVRSICRLKRYFDKYDLDRDGCVNRSELMLLLEDLHVYNNEMLRGWLERRSEEDCLLIFEDFVDAYMTFIQNNKEPHSPLSSRSHKRILRKRKEDEYNTIMQRMKWRDSVRYLDSNSVHRLQYWFNKYDDNGDGRLSLKECMELFEDQGYKLDEERLKNFLMGRGHVTMDGYYDDNLLNFYDIAEVALVFCKKREGDDNKEKEKEKEKEKQNNVSENNEFNNTNKSLSESKMGDDFNVSKPLENTK